MTADRRLNTWKEIGAFLDRNERTAKRWELERGLPVHRVPGGPRGRVYAYVGELAGWLADAPPEPEDAVPTAVETEPEVEPVTTARTRRSLRWPLVAMSAAAAVLVGAVILWALRPAAARPQRPSEFDLRGEYEWSRRTPESLSRAVEAFTQAIVADPQDARAYAGLSRCYILLREFSVMPDAVAYPKAEAAARRAIALDDKLAGAHASLAFVMFYSAWKFPEALREFERAIALEPNNGAWRHWYANALLTLGRYPAAFREIDRAQGLSPGSAAIMADRGLIYFTGGRQAEALDILRAVEKAEPALLSAHRYMAESLLLTGDNAGYLQELQAAATLRGDPDGLAIVTAGKRGYAAGGRRGMLVAISAARQALLATGRGEEFQVAEAYAALHDAPHAVAALQRALSKREPSLLGLKTEAVFQAVASEPGYQAVMRAVGFDSAG